MGRSADILVTYDEVAMPFAIDEDGEEQLRRAAYDPSLLRVGAAGSGSRTDDSVDRYRRWLGTAWQRVKHQAGARLDPGWRSVGGPPRG